LSQKRIKRRLGKQQVEGKDFRLLDEVRYIQQRAAVHDGRLVTLGQLILFSTETGDAWLLDTEDRLATRIAQDGVPLPIHIEDTDTSVSESSRSLEVTLTPCDGANAKIRARQGWPAIVLPRFQAPVQRSTCIRLSYCW
jgi:hypothetical protein